MSKDELGPQFIALGNRNVDVIPTGHGKEEVPIIARAFRSRGSSIAQHDSCIDSNGYDYIQRQFIDSPFPSARKVVGQ